jgi:hypothetical protein
MLRRQGAAFGDEASLVFLPSVVCVFRGLHFSSRKENGPDKRRRFRLLHSSKVNRAIEWRP